jgi:hypothetical protein
LRESACKERLVLPSQVKETRDTGLGCAGLRRLSRRGSWVQIPPPAPKKMGFLEGRVVSGDSSRPRGRLGNSPYSFQIPVLQVVLESDLGIRSGKRFEYLLKNLIRDVDLD